MQDRINDPSFVREQYKDSSNLGARAALHARFGTNKVGFGQWVFDQYRFGERARILELGAGTAGQWLHNRDRIDPNWQIVLSDLSPGMVAEAQRNLRQIDRAILLAIIDAQSIPFADETFDAVIANHMLYHVPDVDRALREIHRVIRPGGVFHAVTNTSHHLHDLAELLRAFDPAIDLGIARGVRAFTLENGGEQIAAHFAGFKRIDWENVLAVTEVEPLVAYVRSGIGNAREILQGERLAEFRRYAQGRIDTEGAIRIRTCAGMFIATKATGTRAGTSGSPGPAR